MIGWVPIEKYNIKVEEPTNQNSLWFYTHFFQSTKLLKTLNDLVVFCL